MAIINEIWIPDKTGLFRELYAQLEDKSITWNDVPLYLQNAFGGSSSSLVLTEKRNTVIKVKMLPGKFGVVLFQGFLIVDEENVEPYNPVEVQNFSSMTLKPLPQDKDEEGKDRQKKGIMVIINF